jgi:hypothetical protein
MMEERDDAPGIALSGDVAPVDSVLGVLWVISAGRRLVTVDMLAGTALVLFVAVAFKVLMDLIMVWGPTWATYLPSLLRLSVRF